MCGIAGSLGSEERVPVMLKALAHRGPDHLGIESAAWGGIGATRLRINGDSRSDMPLRSSSGRTLVVVNGEIFNHRDLYASVAGGSDLSGLPDWIESEGPAALARLRGPFALCAWDTRERSLLLARDEVGVRPLFLSSDEAGVLVASEIAALAAAGVALEPDAGSWDHLLAFQFWPPGRTPWRGVRALRPGTWERFRVVAGRVRREQGTFAWRRASSEGPEEALRQAFVGQARRPLPAALTLSGGLDSSAVLGLLAAAGAPPEIAAVGWFPGASSAFDERSHARAAAREHGVPLIEVPITAEDWWEATPRLLAALGGPLAGPGGPSQWIVARALAAEGIRIVYSGQGGDELFGGYERHRLLQLSDCGLPLAPSPGYEPLAAQLASGGEGGLLFRAEPLLRHLTPERARGVLKAAAAAPARGAELAERTLAFEWEQLLPGLLAVEDATVAAFGMEGRVPLLDPGLVRAIRPIPLASKSPPHDARRLFRSLVGTRLPAAARRRRDKMGFPVPLDDWFRGPLRHLLHEHPGLPLLADLGFATSLRAALQGGALGARNTAFVLAIAETLHQRRRGVGDAAGAAESVAARSPRAEPPAKRSAEIRAAAGEVGT